MSDCANNLGLASGLACRWVAALRVEDYWDFSPDLDVCEVSFKYTKVSVVKIIAKEFCVTFASATLCLRRCFSK